MTYETKLYFSLAPVQGFISKARRTRDFWVGSYLLSYLTGHAVLEVIQSGGKIYLPAVKSKSNTIEDPLLESIRQTKEKGLQPGNSKGDLRIATLPNRFVAGVADGFNPEKCVQVLNKAWEDICEVVWDNYLKDIHDLGENTKEIWKRQIYNYWDINWVLVSDSEKIEGDPLEGRKNWRSHVPLAEPGDKCTLFGNMQELSGYIRMKNRNKQSTFWSELRKKTGYELAKDERLCAIALVKRLFPRVVKKVAWNLPSGYPSTPYISASKWMQKVIKDRPDKAKKFAEEAKKLPGAEAVENYNMVGGFEELAENTPILKGFLSLSGNCFFKSTLNNLSLWQGGTSEPKEVDVALNKNLGAITEKLKAINGNLPPPFYAMFLADGDLMGKLINENDITHVSQSLNDFSNQVPSIVSKYNGVTVYAGGDDVKALLPLETALSAAVELNKVYKDAFAKNAPTVMGATLSGAIVYAHFNTPLTAVVNEAHYLLDDIAKTKTGRSSLAITVWKGAGKVLTWAAPWEAIHDVDKLTNKLAEGEISHAFFYRIKNILEKMGPDILLNRENSKEKLKYFMMEEYLKAYTEESNNQKTKSAVIDRADEIVGQLLKICYDYKRDGSGKIYSSLDTLQLDAPMLIKFLVQKGEQ